MGCEEGYIIYDESCFGKFNKEQKECIDCKVVVECYESKSKILG